MVYLEHRDVTLAFVEFTFCSDFFSCHVCALKYCFRISQLSFSKRTSQQKTKWTLWINRLVSFVPRKVAIPLWSIWIFCSSCFLFSLSIFSQRFHAFIFASPMKENQHKPTIERYSNTTHDNTTCIFEKKIIYIEYAQDFFRVYKCKIIPKSQVKLSWSWSWENQGSWTIDRRAKVFPLFSRPLPLMISTILQLQKRT